MGGGAWGVVQRGVLVARISQPSCCGEKACQHRFQHSRVALNGSGRAMAPQEWRLRTISTSQAHMPTSNERVTPTNWNGHTHAALCFLSVAETLLGVRGTNCFVPGCCARLSVPEACAAPAHSEHHHDPALSHVITAQQDAAVGCLYGTSSSCWSR